MKNRLLIIKKQRRKWNEIVGFLLILFVGLSLTSCADVEFEVPMPEKGKVLKQFPKSLQGEYSAVVMGGREKITIGNDYIDESTGKKSLSESLILKQSNGKYVLNIKKETFGKGEAGWNSYVIEEAGCGFLRVSLMAISDKSNKNEEAKQNLERFKSTYSPQIDSNNRYLLSIDDKQFWELMTDAHYTLTVVLDKIK